MNDKTLVEEFADTCSRCHELLSWDALYLDNGERLCNECEDRAMLTPASITARLIEWANSAEKSSMAGTATLCRQAADTIEAQATRIEALEAALRWYADQMCEGWCDKDPIACEAIGADNCAGCPSRVALEGSGND